MAEKFRIDREYDPLMAHIVDLGQTVALILVDKKNVAGMKIVKTVVDEKLFSAGNGVVDLIAVVDVNVHSLFIVI